MKFLNRTEVAAFQTAINKTLKGTRALPLKVDGDWGGDTQTAFEKWAGVSNPNDSRWPLERDMAWFYGLPGSGLTQIVPPYQFYYGGSPVKSITVHKKIAAPVTRILTKVLAHYGQEKISKLKLDVYDGCYSNRLKRGGATLSTHAYGAALDFYAEKNQLRQDHTTALFAKPEYKPWWEIWEEEGAVSLGRSSDYDWMHVQFVKI